MARNSETRLCATSFRERYDLGDIQAAPPLDLQANTRWDWGTRAGQVPDWAAMGRSKHRRTQTRDPDGSTAGDVCPGRCPGPPGTATRSAERGRAEVPGRPRPVMVGLGCEVIRRGRSVRAGRQLRARPDSQHAEPPQRCAAGRSVRHARRQLGSQGLRAGNTRHASP